MSTPDPVDLIEQAHTYSAQASRWAGYALIASILTTGIAIALFVIQTAELLGWRP